MAIDVENDDFNVFVGAHTGIFKGISINPKTNIYKNFNQLASLEPQHEILSLRYHCNRPDSSIIVTSIRNQTVKLFDTSLKRFITTLHVANGNVHCDMRDAELFSDRLVTSADNGLIRVWPLNSDFTLTANPIVEFNAIDAELLQSGKLKHKANIGQACEHYLVQRRKGKELCRMRMGGNDATPIFAMGGQEHYLSLWNLERVENGAIFRAKNVAHDKLQLRVPVWISDFGFMNEACNIIATCSRYGDIRLYDTRKCRRPVVELKYPGEALTSLAPVGTSSSASQILIGSAKGSVVLFDFRQETKGIYRKYKGSAGSVRGIYCATNTPYFGCVGLDRFLRIFCVNSKQLVSKMYLKSRLNCLLLRDNFDPFKQDKTFLDKEKPYEQI